MSDVSQLPPNVQERVARLQQLQNTLQQLLAQGQRLEAEMSESERALKTLEETPAEAKTYRSVGAILVERDRETLKKELRERIDFLGMRKKVLEKQEDKTKERLQELQQTLQKELGVTQ
jgi:prefoldin beta subunit